MKNKNKNKRKKYKYTSKILKSTNTDKNTIRENIKLGGYRSGAITGRSWV